MQIVPMVIKRISRNTPRAKMRGTGHDSGWSIPGKKAVFYYEGWTGCEEGAVQDWTKDLHDASIFNWGKSEDANKGIMIQLDGFVRDWRGSDVTLERLDAQAGYYDGFEGVCLRRSAAYYRRYYRQIHDMHPGACFCGFCEQHKKFERDGFAAAIAYVKERMARYA